MNPSSIHPNSGQAPNAAAALEEKRRELARKLAQVLEAPDVIPLSFAQQRLWFLDQLEPNSALYNIPAALRLRGPLDRAALQKALDLIVTRHEALRTCFVQHGEWPAQQINPPQPVEMRVLDFTAEPIADGQLLRLVEQECCRPFDLSKDPMMRATLLCVAPEDHVLVLAIHHIAADEWSLRVLFRELQSVYCASLALPSPALSELPIQYGDYALWQRQWLRSEIWDQQLGYWKKQLAGNPPLVELPADFVRPPVQTYRGNKVVLPLPPGLSDALKAFSRQEGVTLFMTLLAAFKVLLARHTRLEDILVGSPIAGRNRVETEGLIGFFVNTLVLRTDLTGRPSFRELLRRVREVVLGAHAHQDFPFDKLVEELHPERSSSHAPFLKVIFALQHELADDFQLPGLQAEVLDVDTGTAKFELTMIVKDARSGMSLLAEYNSDLFHESSVERLLRQFSCLLESALACPDSSIWKLTLATELERHELLVSWNATETAYPAERTVQALFEEEANKRPEATAVVFHGTELTYAGLNQRANQLAHYLMQCGAARGTHVGICLERSADLIVALLAVLKTGAAYVPLDPSYPPERLAFMRRDAQLRLLIVEEKTMARFRDAELFPSDEIAEKARLICLEAEAAQIERQSTADPKIASGSADLAYVIYTSGSTGKPKGVCVPHRAIVRLVRETNYVQLTAADRIAQASNASFDAATFEIWGALLNGGCVVGISREVSLSPQDFAEELKAHRITTLFLTTALFNQMAAEVPGAFETLRQVLFGGELVDPRYVREVLNHRPPQRLLHVYGPTETTTFATWFEIRHVPDNTRTIPIGRPISNTTAYILDEEMQPVPVGVPGELYLGGDGLADGYLDRPELTQGKFVPHPFANRPGARLYKTGDLARFLPDGNIEFIGRVDHQVKIRGFRVELGEIESILITHAAVREAAVVLHNHGSKKLIAYWTLQPGADPPNASELRRHLQEQLPDYMVPAQFIRLEQMPLSPNGKIDRARLPAPDFSRPELEKTYEAPRDTVERQLTGIWEKILGVHSIGVTDNFFELGGHSLLAVRLFTQIEKTFHRKLPLATLFRAPTIEELGNILRQKRVIPTSSLLVEIQPQGSKPPFFWIHSLGGDGGGGFFYYRKLAQLLGPDQPSYGIRSPQEPYTRIEDMAARYIDEIRSLQPDGPYFLGGFCFGGTVAFEMARQLEARGLEVGLLVLLESTPPNLKQHKPRWDVRLIEPFFQNLQQWILDAWQTGLIELLARLGRRRKLMQKRLLRLFIPARAGRPEVDLRDVIDMSDYPRDFVKYAEAHWEALRNYVPQPYRGRITLFRARKQGLMNFDPSLGWAAFTSGGVAINIIPGTHEKMLEEPNVQILAQELKTCLLEAQVRETEVEPASPPGPSDSSCEGDKKKAA
jgi:amino acid adenylation domain-containing protein